MGCDMQYSNTIEITAPQALQARIDLPASKSISNRALIINALSRSEFQPENLSDCDDTRVMVAALHDMPEVIDIGAAGTAMRFLTAYLSVVPGTHVITGTERMRHRPIGVLVDALRQLGAHIEYEGEEGFPPLRITGNPGLQGGSLTMLGNVSSQYISALLMIGPTLGQGLRLSLQGDIVSRPYLDMTVAMMREFGAQVAWESESTLYVSPQPYQPRPYVIENDWSAASYWYEMVALTADGHAEILLPRLYENSLQGDKMVAMVYNDLGVQTEFIRDAQGGSAVRLTKNGEHCRFFEYGFKRIPDLAQTVAVTLCMVHIPFSMTGLQTLRIKETDRIVALQAELLKLGCRVEAKADALDWGCEKTEVEEAPAIATYDDHRMAMAFAPACLRVPCIRIQHPEVVSKSYPTYWEDLQKAGFTICS